MVKENLFVELLQVSVGTRDVLSRVPSAGRTGGRVPVSRIIGVSNNQ